MRILQVVLPLDLGLKMPEDESLSLLIEITEEMQDIRTMLNELKATAKPVKGAETLFSSQKESIGPCPHCGRPVTESDKGFFCTNHSCRFAIWKDNKFLAGQQIAVNRQLVLPLLRKPLYRQNIPL